MSPASGQMSPATPDVYNMADIVWQQTPSPSPGAFVEDVSDEFRRWRAQALANAEQIANTYTYAERQARIAQQTARIVSQTDTVLQRVSHNMARIAEAQSGSASASASASVSASVLP